MLAKLFNRGPRRADAPKLTKPRDLPQPIGTSLVVVHKEDPDWVWKLKCVSLPDPEHPQRELFRVFDYDHCQGHGVRVRDYTSLDPHPSLVLYHGWLDKKTREMELVDPNKPRRAAGQ
jgi:hypothetical protein